MKEHPTTLRQARTILAVLGLIFLALTLTSLAYDLRELSGEYLSLAAEMGRSFSSAVDTFREWNLANSGIYIQISEKDRPNPYLSDPLRDVTTLEGLKLTKINHAHMTRLYSDLLTDQRGIHIHLTGLHPIRPDNSPDSWERAALQSLEGGKSEEFGVIKENGIDTFKYMAPLKTKAICMSCHSDTASSERPIQGGIGVSFAYLPFQSVMAKDRQKIIFIHGMFFVIGIALLTLTGSLLLRSIGALQETTLKIKRLEGLLPICAQCKKIRLEGMDRKLQDSWVEIERYIQDRTDAEFSHGICPACASHLYPAYFPKAEQASKVS